MKFNLYQQFQGDLILLADGNCKKIVIPIIILLQALVKQMKTNKYTRDSKNTHD